MSRKNKLFRHTLIYAVGNFGSKSINIVLLPFYTNFLTKAEYGTIDIILISLILLAPLASVNMAEAVFRFCVDREYEREKVLNIGILTSLVGLLIFGLMIPGINIYFNDINLLCSFGILLSVFILQSVLKQYVRALEKLNIYMLSDFLQVLVFVGLVILFVAKYEMGIRGFVYAKIISLLIDFTFLLLSTRAYRAFRSGIEPKYFKQMLFFAAPLIPNSLMWWVSNASDRYLLASMVGLSSVGIYSVAAKFPIILAQLSTVFFKSWQTSAIEQDSAKDSSVYHTKVFNSYACVLFLMASVILVFIKPLMKILVSVEFFSAWRYIPFLLLGAVFSALAGFLGINYNVAKDTKRALFSTILAALVNICLNLILIPYYSIMGAAASTLVSFIILFGLRVYDTPRYKDIKFNFKIISLLTMSFTLQSSMLFLNISDVHLLIIQVFLFGISTYLCKNVFIERTSN